MQILIDPGIHSNLVTFVALLIPNKCFLLHDVITYVLRPILHVQQTGQLSSASPQHSTRALQFVISLTLHLLVDEYIEGNRLPSSSSSLETLEHNVQLPPFVQHNLLAQCRQLDFAYIVVLLKDLLKVSQPPPSMSRGGGAKGLLAMQQQSISENDPILSQV